MSGSGGGGFTTYDPPVIACENLIIETAISSPKAAVVSKLNVGDVLDVGLENAPGSMAVALYSNGQLAGGITHPSTNRLRECIQGGHSISSDRYVGFGWPSASAHYAGLIRATPRIRGRYVGYCRRGVSRAVHAPELGRILWIRRASRERSLHIGR